MLIYWSFLENNCIQLNDQVQNLLNHHCNSFAIPSFIDKNINRKTAQEQSQYWKTYLQTSIEIALDFINHSKLNEAIGKLNKLRDLLKNNKIDDEKIKITTARKIDDKIIKKEDEICELEVLTKVHV